MRNKKGNLGMAAYDLVFIESGRQDSNLRPSAPKALPHLLQAQVFRAVSEFLLSFTLFLKTIHEVFDHYLTTFSKINSV